ncbi:MAG: glycosyltransferase family 2 protein [Ferruginibacter sp.]|nr:glycosyltransferase family 2 protein [Ferruginibacter sp.]
MEKTIALVVTYNRCALLSRCITALRNQTHQPDAILVINNGSTDNTEHWLQSQKDIFFITQKNVGSGGGFNTGIQWAFKHNYTWMWCMDDDGYPKEDALENILAAKTEPLSLRNCAVINIADKKSFVWKTGNYTTIDDVDTKLIKGIGHPFNGTLLHRNIVERVGLPKANLFVWGDESEYYCRITKTNNIPIYTVTDSIHYHPPALFSFRADWDFKNNWKMYYYVRNRFHINQSKFNNKAIAFANYCCFLVAVAGIIVLFQKTNKMEKLGFIAWPALDALSRNYEATPQSVLSKLRVRSERSTNGGFALMRYLFLASMFPFTPMRTRSRAMNV